MDGKSKAEEEHPAIENQIPRRFILVCLCFWGVLTLFALRLNLSVAIVAMVRNDQRLNLTDNNSKRAVVSNASYPQQEVHVGKFSWDPDAQALVLGAFYYGYFIALFAAGMIAQRVGGKWTVGVSLLVMSVLTLLTPSVTREQVYGLVALRALIGCAAGTAYPGIHVVLAKWTPAMEKNRITAIVFAGTQLGPVISQAVAGILADSCFLRGWPSVFYVMGLPGCGLALVWIMVISESPKDHPNISDQEREYIEQTTKFTSFEERRTPWASILASQPFWGIFVTRICVLWCQMTQFSYIPTYIQQVFHIDTKENGVLSALPCLVCWLVIMVAGSLSDFLSRLGMSTKTLRKLMNTIGMIFPALMLVATSYTECDVTINVLFLTLAVGFTGFTYSGYYVSHFDIAPRYSGPIFGVCNSAGAVSGFTAPYLVGFIMSEKQTEAEWRVVFFICGGVYIFGAAVFLLCAEGEVQPWAADKSETDTRSASDLTGQYGSIHTTEQSDLIQSEGKT